MVNVLFLVDFFVIKFDLGLIFWMILIFLLVWVLFGCMVFGLIQNVLKKWENDIQDVFDEACNVCEEMVVLQFKNEELLCEVQEECVKILKEVKEIKEVIVKEVKEKVQDEVCKIVNNVKQDIENQCLAVMMDLKNQVGVLFIEIVEKLLCC